jgi:hypothetical protein
MFFRFASPQKIDFQSRQKSRQKSRHLRLSIFCGTRVCMRSHLFSVFQQSFVTWLIRKTFPLKNDSRIFTHTVTGKGCYNSQIEKIRSQFVSQ